MPNAKLAEMEIENISEREKIRFKTEIRLDYSTDAKQLQAIINDIKALLKQHEKVDESPMRVTFKGFGNAGLELNVLPMSHHQFTGLSGSRRGVAAGDNGDCRRARQQDGARRPVSADTQD